MENNFNIGKTLKTKKDKFSFFDSGFSCVAFIVLLLITRLFVRFAWTKDIQQNLADTSVYLYLFLYVIIAILVEAVFFFAGLITANNGKVAYFKATTFNKKPSGKTLLFALIISVVSIFAFSGLTNVFVYSLQKFGYKTSLSNIYIPNFGFYILYVIIVGVVPAICEESLFRGVILQGFRGKGKHFAVLMSALLFMLMHGGPDQTVHQFILGVILGYVFIYSGSLWVTIFIHFLNNFISVTMIYITSAGAVVSETTETATQLPSWGTLAFTLVYSLALAALGAYIIYVCIKQMKKEKDLQYEKDKALMISLVSKDNLTNQEVALLKNAISQVKEYELQNNKSDGEDILSQNQSEKLNQDSEKDNEDTVKKEDKTIKIAGIVLLVISLTYLAVDWILTLVNGFLG